MWKRDSEEGSRLMAKGEELGWMLSALWGHEPRNVGAL